MGLPGADLFPFLIQVAGTLLFCLVFLFLWRQSGAVYFGLWSAAWALEAGALACGRGYLAAHAPVWLVFYTFLEFSFVILLVAAARAGFSGSLRTWRGALQILSVFPLFATAAVAFGQRSGYTTLHALHALLLGAVYIYNFTSIRGTRLGTRLFRLTLLSLGGVFLGQAGLLIYLETSGAGLRRLEWLRYFMYYDFSLNTLLAFAAMAMWIESQRDRVSELAAELDRVRREQLVHLDLDRLTGLLNQSALSKRIEEPAPFEGVVTVCDMDAFKEINDRYGHLVGDEILRSIGHLLQTSIRPEDEAFRWGGDEFVVLFRNGNLEVAGTRMREIGDRLLGFRVRGHGVLPITFSWGAAEAHGRQLRDVLDEADHKMYKLKRGGR